MGYFSTPNDNTRAGMPIKVEFTLDGAPFSMLGFGDRLHSLSPISCKAEPLEGKFSVSELRCTFADTDGSLWGYMGKGTSNLDMVFSATAYLGGSVNLATYFPRDFEGSLMRSIKQQGTTFGGTYALHTGKTFEVSRKGRLTTILSKSSMQQVGELEWKFPVGSISKAPDHSSGSFVFFNEDLRQTYPASLFKLEGSSFEAYGYVGGATEPYLYATNTGRGTMGLAGSQGFIFPGTQFYFDYKRFQLNGTYLGTYSGALVGTETDAESIADSEETAREYGFVNANAARAAIFTNSKGTFTRINKTRFKVVGELPDYTNGTKLVFQQGDFLLQGNPAVLWNELLTSYAVSPYFSSSDIEAESFGSARRIVAYYDFSQHIDPKGGKVLPYIKSLLEPMQSLFSVNKTNQLRIYLSGPRTLIDLAGTIGNSEIISSSVSSSLEDRINRVSLSYGYNLDSGSYTKSIELRGTNWSFNDDYPLTMESGWINNDNEARTVAQRIIRRYSNGVPRLELSLPLSQLELDIGSLVTLSDADQGFTNKPFEVVGWSKDFDRERLVSVSMLDGDALYQRKGYARWEDGSTKEELVSGTSTAGWGTLGTVNNINGSVYGRRFVWF